MRITLNKTEFNNFGVCIKEEGVYVCVSIPHLRKAGMNVYDIKTGKLYASIDFDEKFSTGDVYCLMIKGLDTKDKGYRFFDDTHSFVDKYASKIIGNEVYGRRVSKDDLYGGFVSKRLSEESVLKLPYEDLVMYLVHPRGYTMANKNAKENKGTFEALSEKIKYFKSLGVNAIELMPVNEYIECPKAKGLSASEIARRYKDDLTMDNQKINYWGYDDAYHFAIKSSYGYKDASLEFSKFVSKLHDNKIECIVQMYYKETKDTDYIVSSLINMVIGYGVDGFRLLGNDLPINEIVKNPFLSNVKIMADNDFNNFQGMGEKYFHNLCFYNDQFMNRSRKFLKGDEDMVSYMSYALRENHRNVKVAHYITDYYGFTLNDLVSYNRKHNEANDENNEDGSSYNYSWNCGEEGPTAKRTILSLRKKQARNAMLMLMLGQAMPVIRGGDEILNSQNGNNNPYCQDNGIGWVDWSKSSLNTKFFNFTKNLIAFRRRHVILHQANELRLTDYLSCRIPDVSFHGEEAFRMNQDNDSREFAILFGGPYSRQYSKKTEESIYIAFNLHWEDRTFNLPMIDEKKEWKLLYSTDGSTDESFDEKNAIVVKSDNFVAKGRTISIYIME